MRARSPGKSAPGDRTACPRIRQHSPRSLLKSWYATVASRPLVPGADWYSEVGPRLVKMVLPVRRNPVRRSRDGLVGRVMQGRRQVRALLVELAGLVAPEPSLARLEAADDWVPGVGGVSAGVLRWRRVAAADVPALRAPSQVKPPATSRLALGAAGAARNGGLVDSWQRAHHCSSHLSLSPADVPLIRMRARPSRSPPGQRCRGGAAASCGRTGTAARWSVPPAPRGRPPPSRACPRCPGPRTPRAPRYGSGPGVTRSAGRQARPAGRLPGTRIGSCPGYR